MQEIQNSQRITPQIGWSEIEDPGALYRPNNWDDTQTGVVMNNGVLSCRGKGFTKAYSVKCIHVYLIDNDGGLDNDRANAVPLSLPLFYVYMYVLRVFLTSWCMTDDMSVFVYVWMCFA